MMKFMRHLHAVHSCKHWYLSRSLAPVIYRYTPIHSVTMSPLSVLLVAAALLHCGLATTPATGVRTTNTELFSGYDLRQRIAYRIGQVECLKSLQSEGNTQYGLGLYIVVTTPPISPGLASGNG